ncbi:MAG: carbohydrate-binding family 9-like protein [Armatimonadetes bacterium]|nr:carbohydrate-binding family 9-like protein [Armatimonadota bacterium]
MRTCLIAVCLGACTWALAQAPPPWGDPFSLEKSAAYQCVRAEKAITIDGKLDETAWAAAQQIEHFMVPPGMDWISFQMTRARRARSLTRAKLMWDDKYLYLGAEMEDRDITCVTPKGHDLPFGADDIVELFIKPSDEQPWYWEIHIVPSGGTRDYCYARRGAGSDKRWMPYESGMKAAVTLSGTFDDWTDRDNEWIAEMRLPWSAFDKWGGKPRVGDCWRFMVSRYDYSVHLEDGRELSAAAPLPWANFHLFEYYPYLTFR